VRGSENLKINDTKTGKIYDEYSIGAEMRDVAKEHGIIHLFDIDGFYVSLDGCIIMADQCGNHVYLSSERFKVIQ
jgi:hypothetical protein